MNSWAVPSVDDDLEEFRVATRDFVRAKFADGYFARASSDDFPVSAYQLLAGQGLLGLTVPERLGGAEAGDLAYGIALEELAWADFNLAQIVLTVSLVAASLVGTQAGDDAAGNIATGARIVALALTEPGTGSDARNLRTRAVPERGGWRLSGEKTSISLAPHADSAVVFAQTPAGGSTAFLVDLDGTVSRQQFRDPGIRPTGRGSLTFDGTFVPTANVVSEEGRGFQHVMRSFDLSRATIGLMACGIARRAMDMTVDYVKERSAFGRTISQFQGVSFVLAENDTRLELTRALAYRALGLRQAGLAHSREAAMVKWWGPEVAVQAIHDCIVLHGHTGWSDEMPLQQMMRDVSGMEIADGTPQIQKLVIARALLGREFVD